MYGTGGFFVGLIVAAATLFLKRLISLKIYQNRSNSVKKPKKRHPGP